MKVWHTHVMPAEGCSIFTNYPFSRHRFGGNALLFPAGTVSMYSQQKSGRIGFPAYHAREDLT
jgi:hypothetical protein